MYFMEDWQNMRQVDLKDVNPDDVVDISEIVIDTEQPVSDRVRTYVEAVRNPFLVKIDGYVVKLEYSDCEETLNDRIKQYISKMTEITY